MKNIFKASLLTFFCGAVYTVSAATVCPVTANTTSDCNFLITIGSTGTATVTTVPGSSPFNGPINFIDGTSDPGSDGSLIGVINNSSMSLGSFTITGAGANAGVFDFSYNGICVYTMAAYCTTAASGYEGPTTTFSDLQSTVLFETTQGDVTFNPGLASGSSTFFALEDTAADINANGGLQVSKIAFSSAPEPADMFCSRRVSEFGLIRRKTTKS